MNFFKKVHVLYMLWFKIFKPVLFLFAFVSDYDNESETGK